MDQSFNSDTKKSGDAGILIVYVLAATVPETSKLEWC